MDTQIRSKDRQWQVLCWNIRGINAPSKWTAIQSKARETKCDIICLQETKRENFNSSYLRNFCSPDLDSFEFCPSNGSSGGTIIIWKSSRFLGQVVFQNQYAMSVEFTSVFSGATWILTNIYAPCTTEGRQEFLSWLHDVDMPEDTDWFLVGDFNLIRRSSDRNKSGGNIQDMLRFNAVISNLRLEELKLNGNKFTWTNKQQSPLLKRLDWFFTSTSWMTNYPGSAVTTLSRDISDHSPCLISITTDIPRSKVFRFENYWLLHDDYECSTAWLEHSSTTSRQGQKVGSKI
jgi:exonuclease III